jgi:hypothetical protein
MPAGNTTKGSTSAAAVVGLGGAVMVIAAFLAWVKVDYGRIPQLLHQTIANTTVSGVSGSNDGRITLAVGVVLLVAAVLIAMGSSPRLRRGMATVAVLVAAIGLVVVVINLATKDSQFNDAWKKQTGHTPTPQERAILDRLGFDVSYAIGIYVTGVGALIGLAGGVMGIAVRSAAPAPTMTAGSGEGWSVGGAPPAPAPAAGSEPSSEAVPAAPEPPTLTPPAWSEPAPPASAPEAPVEPEAPPAATEPSPVLPEETPPEEEPHPE